jgi:putative membrane protein
MPWHEWQWQWHWPMMFLMGLLWIAVLAGVTALIVWVARQSSARAPAGGWGTSDDPFAILKQRYARGEIDREEYERMRREME